MGGNQAGPGELETALRSCGAVELDGRWHVMEPGYHDMLFEVMILTAIQNGWQLPRIPLAPMVEELGNDGFDSRWAFLLTGSQLQFLHCQVDAVHVMILARTSLSSFASGLTASCLQCLP